MENLDKVLAELCEKLGVGSEGLVKWLTDGGLQSYAELQATSYLTDGLIWLMVVLILAGVSIWCWKYVHSDSADFDCEFVAVCIMTVAIICALIFAVMAMVAFEHSFFWYTNPDGMFVKLVLEMLS